MNRICLRVRTTGALALLLLVSAALPAEATRPSKKNTIRLQSGYAARQSDKNGTLEQVDPLTKVIPGADYALSGDTLRAARGETATLQLVLTAGRELLRITPQLRSLRAKKGAELTQAAFGWVANVRSSFRYEPMASDDLPSPDRLYPDPIRTDTTIDLAPGGQAVLWAEIPIPRNARPGLYKGVLELKAVSGGRPVTLTKKFRLQVYPVTLPEKQALTVVNWTYNTLPYLNGGKPVAERTELYWELQRKIAEIAAAYGQNCWLIRERPSVRLNAEKNGIELDFTRFDEWVEFYRAHGNLQMICGGHFAGRTEEDWQAPFQFYIGYVENGELKSDRVAYDDPRLAEYIHSYFRQLRDHLRSKPLNDGTGRTWLDIYAQHIGDEPSSGGSYDSWHTAARLIKEAAPEIRIIEAYESPEYDPASLDIPVPKTNEHGRIRSYLPAGRQAWIYVCMFPLGEYANRFVNLPLIKTRLLHWINYKYDAPGFLHWGLNCWGYAEDPWQEVSVPGRSWPGGDAYIVYPGYRKVYPSVRLAAMRDGIRDYDLLKMIEAKDAAKAKSIAGRMVLDYDRYDTNVPHFRQIRKEMLEFLSE